MMAAKTAAKRGMELGFRKGAFPVDSFWFATAGDAGNSCDPLVDVARRRPLKRLPTSDAFDTYGKIRLRIN